MNKSVLPNEASRQGSAKIVAVQWVVVANFFLIALKLLVFFFTGSLAVIATLVDSFFDLLGTFFAYFGVHKSLKPADIDHRYGHGKVEGLSGLAQAGLIAATALIILIEATRRIVNPQELTVSIFDLGVILLTILVDLRMASYLKRKSRETSSLSLQAAKANYESDVFQNAAVLAGLFFVQNGMALADPLAAIVLCLFMLRTAFNAGKSSVDELMDKSPDENTMTKIGKAILSVKGVKSFHHLRARTIDGKALADVHIQLSPKITLLQAHKISHQVHDKVVSQVLEVKDILVHAEPEGDKEY